MLFSLVILFFIFVVGLVIGSFLNVVILRTISEESIVFPSSKCPKCQTPLKWYHNIPVLSYLFLKGKCAFCGEKISIQYPIVELLTGILFVGLFLRFCAPFDELFGLYVMNPIGWYQFIVYIFALIVTALLIVITGTDLIERKVSDYHTFSLIGIGVLFSVIYTVVTFVLYTKINGMPEFDWNFFLTCPILYSVAAGICGFLIIEIISRLGLLIVGARAFGEGDSYIAAGLGTVFGALVGASPVYTSFLPVFQSVVIILVLSAAIQIIFTLPIFIKKLIDVKNYMTLGALSGFIIYTAGYLCALNFSWLSNTWAYAICTIILVLTGLFACREIICGIREDNAANALYLPFGPAMAIAGILGLFILVI